MYLFYINIVFQKLFFENKKILRCNTNIAFMFYLESKITEAKINSDNKISFLCRDVKLDQVFLSDYIKKKYISYGMLLNQPPFHYNILLVFLILFS